MKKTTKQLMVTMLATCTVISSTMFSNALDREETKVKSRVESNTLITEESILKTDNTVDESEKLIPNKFTTYSNPENPNNYKTVNKGNLAGGMEDDWGAYHKIYFNGISNYSSSTMEVSITDKTNDPINKDEYVHIEFLENIGGKLNYVGSVVYDTWESKEYKMLPKLKKSDFESQKYLYIRVGLASEPDPDYYSNAIMFKVENPFARDFAGHWAESVILQFMDKGIVGKTNEFRPNDSITRAEFVKILNRVFGLTKTSGKIFKDTVNHWARYDIDIAVTNGVCNGKSATEFKPNDAITREEASVMISNYKNLADKNLDKLSKYSDANTVASWAKPSVEGMIEKGYMGGYSDNTFKPKNKITRAEAVSTFSRIK